MAKPPPELNLLSSADKRSGVEERWVSFQPYLLSKGYRLRPRYQPDWVPSWKGTGLRPSYCEDSIDSRPIRILDAVRITDERQVVIKMVIPERGGEGEHELAILQHFSSPPLKNDPSNHIVPCLDTIPIPGIENGHFIIMPLLGQFDEPAFGSIAEVHDFLQQLFTGLDFMHKHNVAHCDIASANIMMDSRPLYDEPFHPVYQTLSLDIQRMIYPRYSRLEINIRYYFIDMGFATWFRDPESPKMITGKQARERAPEQKTGKAYNPFLVDIYQLGAIIGKNVISQNRALDFLKPLAEEMTHSDPSARPVLVEARQCMNTAFLGLSGIRYRWPLVPRGVGLRARVIYFIWGTVSELRYWLRKLFWMFTRVRL
ncbi:kinase-like domain-containing protein [Rhizoctonia solani]|nr:kinase-like domain-containing protein [Rhizoctonia solani]